MPPAPVELPPVSQVIGCQYQLLGLNDCIEGTLTFVQPLAIGSKTRYSRLIDCQYLPGAIR